MQSRVRHFLGSSPTGLAESSSPIGYGLVIRLRLLSTLSRDNAVTTFDYRLVTIAWTGLAPANSNAFTGALGTAIAGRPPHRSVSEVLPHTAPPLGQTITHRVTCRGYRAAPMMLTPAQCPDGPSRIVSRDSTVVLRSNDDTVEPLFPDQPPDCEILRIPPERLHGRQRFPR